MKIKYFRLVEGVVFRNYKDFGLVINVPQRKSIILNASAAKILGFMKNRISLKNLIAKSRSEGIMQKDISQILSRFEKHKIIKAL